MKKWNDMTSLNLLDDQAAHELPARAWEDLTLKATKSMGVAPKIVTPATAKVPVARPARRPNRVFSSTPTLRQMMQEYNRPTGRQAPVKSFVPDTGHNDFNFEAVDLIELPTIPGKILRPSRS